MLKEWPLVAFTILGQTAVGLFLFFDLPFLLRGRLPLFGWRSTWLHILAATAGLMALAAAISFFHLRHPLRARRALVNLRTSWLSREILFEMGFLGLIGLIGWLEAFKNPPYGLLRALVAAAALAGALFLLSMARLYMLPSLPVWRRIYTPLTFLFTTLVAGAVSTEVVVRVFAGPGAFVIDLTTVALVLLVGEIVLTALSAPDHGFRGFRPAPSLRPGQAPPRFLHWARLFLLLGATALMAADRISGGTDIMNPRGAGRILALALVLVLLGEIAGRFHFYGLVRRPGETAL